MEQETKVLERNSNVLGKEGKFKYNGRTYYYDIPTMSNIEIYDDKRKRVQDLVEEEHSIKFYNSLRDDIHKKNYTIHCLNKMVEELKEELNSLKSEYNAKEVRDYQRKNNYEQQ